MFLRARLSLTLLSIDSSACGTKNAYLYYERLFPVPGLRLPEVHRQAAKLASESMSPQAHRELPEADPAMETNRDFHPLCYEHHIEMGLSQILPDVRNPAQVPSYACPKPNCFIHYDSRQGYFSATEEEGETERDRTPGCPHDGQPMYLAEVKPEKRSFRLWRCPQCNASRTNEEVSQA